MPQCCECCRKETKKSKKKGVSPLIASVLLIAFTMAIAAVLTAWITKFTAEKQEQSAVFEEKFKCSGASIKADTDFAVYSDVANTFSVKLKNTGAIPVNVSEAKIWYDTSTIPESHAINAIIADGAQDTIALVTVTDSPKTIKFETSCEGVIEQIKRPIGGW